MASLSSFWLECGDYSRATRFDVPRSTWKLDRNGHAPPLADSAFSGVGDREADDNNDRSTKRLNDNVFVPILVRLGMSLTPVLAYLRRWGRYGCKPRSRSSSLGQRTARLVLRARMLVWRPFAKACWMLSNWSWRPILTSARIDGPKFLPQARSTGCFQKLLSPDIAITENLFGDDLTSVCAMIESTSKLGGLFWSLKRGASFFQDLALQTPGFSSRQGSDLVPAQREEGTSPCLGPRRLLQERSLGSQASTAAVSVFSLINLSVFRADCLAEYLD